MSILEPAHKIYGEAKMTTILTACPSCKDHQVPVFADGSRLCVMTSESFPATDANPELLVMRRDYEHYLLALVAPLEATDR